MPEFWILQPWIKDGVCGELLPSPSDRRGPKGICAEQSDQDEKTGEKKGSKSLSFLQDEAIIIERKREHGEPPWIIGCRECSYCCDSLFCSSDSHTLLFVLFQFSIHWNNFRGILEWQYYDRYVRNDISSSTTTISSFNFNEMDLCPCSAYVRIFFLF